MWTSLFSVIYNLYYQSYPARVPPDMSVRYLHIYLAMYLPIYLYQVSMADMRRSLATQKPTVNAADLKKLDDFRNEYFD